MDVLAEMCEYLAGMNATLDYIIQATVGLLSTIVGVQLCALAMVLVLAARKQHAALQNPACKVCLALALLHEVQAMPEQADPRCRVAVPGQTDLELWASGQQTMREQMERALANHVLGSPLQRSSGVAPPPAFQVPFGAAQPEELPLRVVGANAVHVTLWTATPFYEAEIVDVELNFPLSLHMIRRALRESFVIIPDWANEVIPTVPQLGAQHASFVACPGWLAQVNQTAMILDARAIGGPVFAFYHEGRVTRAGVLRHIEDFDLSEVEVFPFGSLLPIESGSPVEALPGGVIKVVPRGRVCEWEDDLTDRLEDDEAWDPECDPPGPIEGLYTVLQSTTEQIVYEDDPADPRPPMDMAREVFEEAHMIRVPEEEHAKLAHAGRHIYQTAAVIDRAWPNNGEAAYIYLDLRGIGCFTPLQVEEPEGWTLTIGGGHPLGDNLLRVRDGEIIEMRFEPSSSMSTSEEEPTDEESESSSHPGDPGDSTDHTMDSGSGPEYQGDEPRGPPPPRPVNRSRSPRRLHGTAEEETVTVTLDGRTEVPTHDLSQTALAFPHDWSLLRPLFRPWSPAWMQPPLTDLKLPPGIQEEIGKTKHWSEVLFAEEERDPPVYRRVR